MLVRSTFTTAPGQAEGWRSESTNGGGVLLDLASHEVDLAAWLLGEQLEHVRCVASTGRFAGDTAQLSAQTASGVAFEGFYSFSAIDEARLEVIGDRGKLTVDRYGGLGLETRDASAQGPIRRTMALVRVRHFAALWHRWRSPWHEPSFATSLGRFVDAVRWGASASPDLADGLASLRVVCAAEEAANAASKAKSISTN